MKSISKAVSIALVSTVLISTTVFAELAPKPEKLIQWRQSAFKVAEWSVARIKSSLSGAYNKAEVVAAANTLASIANSGLPSLFAPGTETGKGWHPTEVKLDTFKDRAKFNELMNNFSKEATELAKVAAASNDAAAIKDQFGKVTRTCKACHDDFKGDD